MIYPIRLEYLCLFSLLANSVSFLLIFNFLGVLISVIQPFIPSCYKYQRLCIIMSN